MASQLTPTSTMSRLFRRANPKHKYHNPNDIVTLTEHQIYALDPNSFPSDILDFRETNDIFSPNTDVDGPKKLRAMRFMIGIKKSEKENPREIERREDKIAREKDRNALKQATQDAEERKTFLQPRNRGNQQEDLLMIKQKEQALTELHKEANKLKQQIELNERLIKGSKSLGLSGQPPDEPEKRRRLAQLQSQINYLESHLVADSGGKKHKRKTRKNKKAHNKTAKKRMSKGMLWSHKRPWKVTYRNKNGEKIVNILKNGTEKNTLLKKIEKDKLHIYGINNLTDRQIEIYKNKGFL